MSAAGADIDFALRGGDKVNRFFKYFNSRTEKLMESALVRFIAVLGFGAGLANFIAALYNKSTGNDSDNVALLVLTLFFALLLVPTKD